jgi:hypothetical protein
MSVDQDEGQMMGPQNAKKKKKKKKKKKNERQMME